MPLKKPLLWAANYDLSPMELRCGALNPGLVDFSHQHRHIRGGVRQQDGTWTSVAAYSAGYTPPMVALCARLVQQVSFRQLRGLQHADHVTQGVSLRQQRLNALVGAHVLLAQAQFMRVRLRATALVLHALLVRRGQRQTMPRHAPQ